MDTLKAQIAHRNDGMLATYRSSDQSFKLMMEYKVRIDGNTVTQNGEPLFAIHRRHSSRKTQGCYRELTHTLEDIRRAIYPGSAQSRCKNTTEAETSCKSKEA